MSIRANAKVIVCAFGALAVVLAAGPAGAFSDAAIETCAKRGGKAFKRFAGDAAEILGDCQVDNLKDDHRTNCATQQEVADDLENAGDKLRREMRKCDDDALRALCPHGQRDETDLKEQVLHGATGTAARLRLLDANLFSTSYGGCPRPLGTISQEAEDCAGRIARAAEDGLDELMKCVVKCELNARRRSSAGPCLDAVTGDPVDEKVLDCVELVLDDVDETLGQRCTDATIVELGCPLGRTTMAEVVTKLTDRMFDETARMSSGVFDSECASGGGGSTTGGPTDPAPATLYPSQTATQIDCGQVLDGAFFGDDDEVRLEGDLDCSPAGKDSIGLVVAASGVTIDGNGDYDLTGPSKTSHRTGAGILVAPGATNVTIRRFRAIQRYAVGVGDSGDNMGLHIDSLTVRRNRAAGIRTTSRGVVVSDVKADRNATGFEISGDGSTLTDSRALRSQPAPGVGIHVLGSDVNGDGRVVRVNRCSVEGNLLGVLVAEGPQLLEDNDVRDNLGDGIQVTATGAKLESNSVKRNVGNGIVVSGDGNNVTANRSDENGAHGFVITGVGNDINGNGAGTLTDQGNLGYGFWFAGFDSLVDSNDAEANLLDGFFVEEDTARLKSNTANDNEGIGFHVAVGGNNLDTNVSEDNAGWEFSIAPGNFDDQGNRTNGVTFSFSTSGGNF